MYEAGTYNRCSTEYNLIIIIIIRTDENKLKKLDNMTVVSLQITAKF